MNVIIDPRSYPTPCPPGDHDWGDVDDSGSQTCRTCGTLRHPEAPDVPSDRV